MRRHFPALLLAIALAGCGGSSAPGTNPRNEADWTQAKQEAQREIEPEEALLGVAKAREREAEIAKYLYEAMLDRERAGEAEGEG